MIRRQGGRHPRVHAGADDLAGPPSIAARRLRIGLVAMAIGLVSLIMPGALAGATPSAPGQATTLGHAARTQTATTCTDYLPTGTVVGMAASPIGEGYRIANSAGLVANCGFVTPSGVIGFPLAQPIVAIAATPDDLGFWLVAADGGVFTFGSATFYGSMGGVPLDRPIVGIAPTADGKGYWLVASDGGVFAFGDASFHGSTGGLHVNQPVVGMTDDAATGGYWLVAADGGIFAFDAPFYGSMGGTALNRSVVGVAGTSDGAGYWMVASDGGVFSFGDAVFQGSTGGIALNQPIVGMAPDVVAGGYWLVAADGGVFAFGAQFHGSAVAPPGTPPPPPAAPNCTATVSDPAPSQYRDETVDVTSNVPEALVIVAQHYQEGTSYNMGHTDGSGNASIFFLIGAPPPGVPVPVSVAVGGATCSTSFTTVGAVPR